MDFSQGIEREELEIPRYQGIDTGGLDYSKGIGTEEDTLKLSNLPSEQEVSEEEQAFAAEHPNTYAVKETFFDFLRMAKKNPIAPPTEDWSSVEQIGTLGRRTLFPTAPELEESLLALNDHIPYVRRMWSEEAREEFGKLDRQGQVNSLLWDALEVQLLGTPKVIPYFLKGAGKTLGMPIKVAGKAIKVITPSYKFAPIEDLLLKGVRPFVREESAMRVLRGKGWKSDEVGAVLEMDNLYPFVSSKRGGKLSKAFKESLDWSSGMPRTGAETKELLETGALRRKHFKREWNVAFRKYSKETIEREVGKQLGPKMTPKARKELKKELGKQMNKTFAEEAFNAQVVKALGKDLTGKITLKNAPEIYMANFARDIVKGSKVVKGVLKQGVYNKLMFDSLNPVRVALGAWDRLYGTYKNVYKKIGPGLERRNEYIAEKHLTLFQMYKDRGLGTWSRISKGGLKFAHSFGQAEYKEAYKALLQIDHLTELGRRTPVLKEKMVGQSKTIADGLSPNAKQLVKTWSDFSDHLYAENVLEKIPQLFEGMNLTARGENSVGKMVEKIGPILSKAFAKSRGNTFDTKSKTIQSLLGEVRKTLNHPSVKQGKHPWFYAEGDDLAKQLKALDKNLTTTGKGGNFVDYLENYVARVGQSGQNSMKRWDTALLGAKHPFYEKGRKTIASLDVVEDLSSMMEVRIRAQANDLMLYPEIEKAVTHSKDLPGHVREYVDHYISRVLGRQASMDSKVARVLEGTIGKLGGKNYWTEEKVGMLSRRLNDLAIMGALGFKPFAVMRDLFQPLLTVPVDLGGVKGFSYLLHGYKKAITEPGFRQYVKDIGAIQEFAPEIYLKQRLFSFGKGARWDQARDAALWLYGFGDRLNRYTAGGAAVHKWDMNLAKVGQERLLTTVGRKEFSQRMFKGRYPWVRNELDDLLSLGKVDEAKAIWTNDVIADTQFLYRPTESPIVSQKYGALGRTGFLFQSWWMNYGTLLEKWMRTGDAGAKANKMFTWMTSHAIAATMMESLWGTDTALRTTFTGPFPATFDKNLIPAAWTPIYEVGNMLGWGIPNYIWKGEPEKLEQHAKSLIRSLAIMTPGGLQMKQTLGAVKKEGWEGLPASVIRYQGTKMNELMPIRAYKGIKGMMR